ncbi:PS1 protein [Corynebacterium kutscheri]|uniref:PS1 protein n=1 Tax=Corynebacterium kutscheri TaxID=35755 RepID=A0A0F6R160_9CORY|nr:alpha/beta hydrolase family protein [Corynebacterium kutscheri]AKE42127.1 putative esterase [Corynebacterium kutscheri]VEH05927.1 PS1 protein [Corynebacterium kutscheri]VEH10470.1 PS1 protein [Corynebacterium kutscheri]VEH81816.1 PS1 protein [Corynebacterium kutscheri]
MTFVSRCKTATKKVAATVTAFACATGLMVAGGGIAQAANRDWLRADSTGACEWDGVGFWVQRCDVYSSAMNRNITVQIQPAQRGGNAALYLLDGARATEHANAWTVDTNAPAKFVDNNLTLVMPVGGAGSFYADWIAPATYSSDSVNYKWETFLTAELPAYLESNFGVARNNNSIAGLSMGGTAALNLAARHTDQFRQALSYSGYLTMTHPGMQTLLRIALWEIGGFNVNSMYGSIFNPVRYQNDPFLNMAALRNTDVYISAGNGLPAGPDIASYRPQDIITGSILEWISRYTTVLWEVKARATGVHPTVNYPITGIHNWLQFNYQLDMSRGRILDVMNAW